MHASVGPIRVKQTEKQFLNIIIALRLKNHSSHIDFGSYLSSLWLQGLWSTQSAQAKALEGCLVEPSIIGPRKTPEVYFLQKSMVLIKN